MANPGLTRPQCHWQRNRDFAYYIRKGSASVRARHQEEVELVSLAATVPFDDRIHHNAALSDLDLPLIQSFLREVGSDFLAESGKMDLLNCAARCE